MKFMKRAFSLKPLSKTTALWYLKLVNVPSLCPFYIDLPLDVIGAVCHQLCSLGF